MITTQSLSMKTVLTGGNYSEQASLCWIYLNVLAFHLSSANDYQLPNAFGKFFTKKLIVMVGVVIVSQVDQQKRNLTVLADVILSQS